MVEGAALEMLCGETHPGFESLTLRHIKRQVSTETCRFQLYLPYGKFYCVTALFDSCRVMRSFREVGLWTILFIFAYVSVL